MHKYILIDTNIWEYAYVEPKEDELKEIYNRAHSFIMDILNNPNVIICMSTYHIAEILEVLRKCGISVQTRENLYDFFISSAIIIELSKEHIGEAFSKSKQSNIHIYDYLVAIPVLDIISAIYTADEHFFHKDFSAKIKIMNPISPWILSEGKKPERRIEKNERFLR